MPSGEAAKYRRGFRGWMILRSTIDGVLKANPTPFALKNGYLKMCPKRLYWPDADDYDGMHALISAVIDRDLAALETIYEEYPEFELGIKDYIAMLKDNQTTADRRLLQTTVLPRGLRLDVELIKDNNNVKVIRAVIRRGPHEIASKTLARKEPKSAAKIKA